MSYSIFTPYSYESFCIYTLETNIWFWPLGVNYVNRYSGIHTDFFLYLALFPLAPYYCIPINWKMWSSHRWVRNIKTGRHILQDRHWISWRFHLDLKSIHRAWSWTRSVKSTCLLNIRSSPQALLHLYLWPLLIDAVFPCTVGLYCYY